MLCTEIQCVFLLNPKMFVKKFLEDFDFERLEKTFPYLHEDEHKLPLPLIVTNTFRGYNEEQSKAYCCDFLYH